MLRKLPRISLSKVGRLLVVLILLNFYLAYYQFGHMRNRRDSLHIGKYFPQNAGNLTNVSQNLELESDFIQFKYPSDGQTCQIPRLNPFSKNILRYLENQRSYWNCQDLCPVLFSSTLDGEIVPEKIAKEFFKLDIVTCCYNVISRGKSNSLDESFIQSNSCYPLSLDHPTKIPPSHEFIAISCTRKALQGLPIYFRLRKLCNTRINPGVVDMHAFIPEKPEVTSRIEKTIKEGDNDRVNVVIFGIDAVSRMNFVRTMPESYEFLTQILAATDFTGYNKVADNTFPNIMPMLTSLSNAEVGAGCGKKKQYDSCPFIWKQFSKQGYVTSFAEDESYISIFNFGRKGFLEPPTDYYLKPFGVAADALIASQKIKNSRLCYGPRLGFQFLLEYMKKFVFQMNKRRQPYFQFTWATSLSHDDLNAPKMGDKHLLTTLQWLRDRGYFNTTVFLLMSDHGQRVDEFRSTLQGQLEDRLPFLLLHLPDWMRKGKYSNAYKNLCGNRDRLVTTFDLYQTLHDILYLNNIGNDMIEERSDDLSDFPKAPRGISLFLPIPKQRTCAMAEIELNYCSCNYLKPIGTHDKRVKKAAIVAVRKINSIVRSEKKCARLKLGLIKMARKGAKSHNFDFDSFQVNFETWPGGALFEAFVSKTKAKRWEVLGNIARINRYGNQSHCVDDTFLKLYCYCGTSALQ